MAQMPEFLRLFFANKKIERPATMAVPGVRVGGAYSPDSGRVIVPQDTDDASLSTLHELLHALNYEHPLYQSEPHTGWSRMRDAGMSGPDLPHVFTDNGVIAARDPERLELPAQTYFAPILPPVQQLRRGRPR